MTGEGLVEIANPGVAGESGQIRIGTTGEQTRTFLAGISGATLSGPAQPVLIKANGQLGTASGAAKLAAQSGVDRRFAAMRALMRRQQREIDELRARLEAKG